MNQILVTQKLYVTPELKKKKKVYKVLFIFSIIVVLTLIAVYVYAEHDRNANEDISKDILEEMNLQTEQAKEDNDLEREEQIWKIELSNYEEENVIDTNIIEEKNNTINVPNVETNSTINESSSNTITNEVAKVGTFTASNGKKYDTIGTIKIPVIKVNYPIFISKTDTKEDIERLLKVSPCRWYGPETVNEVGNLCIAGHNYRNNKFFSKVLKLTIGDIIEITDLNNKTVKYSVYDKYEVIPEDSSCTDQETNGKKIITLITCTNDSKKRVIVHAKEIS